VPEAIGAAACFGDGAVGGACALVLAAVAQRRLGRPMLILTAHLDEADDALDQLMFFRPGCDARMYPAFEVLPGESNLSHELAAQRLELLVDLATERRSDEATKGDRSTPGRIPDFIVAPIQALMQPSPKRELLDDLVLAIRVGQTIDRDNLVRWLTDQWVQPAGCGGGGGGILRCAERSWMFGRRVRELWMGRGPAREVGGSRCGLIFLGIRWSRCIILNIESLGRRGILPRRGWWRWGIARPGRLSRRRVC